MALNGKKFKKFVKKELAIRRERKKVFKSSLQKARLEEAKKFAKAKAAIETKKKIARLQRISKIPTVRQSIATQRRKLKKVRIKGKPKLRRLVIPKAPTRVVRRRKKRRVVRRTPSPRSSSFEGFGFGGFG